MEQKYGTEEFKKSVVKRLLSPNSLGITALSQELGIPRSTISDWREKYKYDILDTEQQSDDKSPITWSFLEKYDAILETEKLNENDLGLWLRENGLKSEHITLWKEELRYMAKNNKNNKELNEAKREIKKLKSDLRKKEKALAEASALLILKKKASLIWGEEEV